MKPVQDEHADLWGEESEDIYALRFLPIRASIACLQQPDESAHQGLGCRSGGVLVGGEGLLCQLSFITLEANGNGSWSVVVMEGGGGEEDALSNGR